MREIILFPLLFKIIFNIFLTNQRLLPLDVVDPHIFVMVNYNSMNILL